MRDIDRGLAQTALQPLQLLAHLDAQLEVEVGQRLVEHQDARLEHQRAGDRDALLLAARKLRREARAHPGRSTSCRTRPTRSAISDLAEAAQPQSEGDVVEHRQMREQRVVLEHQADIAAVRRLVVEPLAVQPDRAPARALSNPAMQRKVVVLPQPLGPSSEKNSPSCTSNDIGPTLTCGEYRFVSSHTSSSTASGIINPAVPAFAHRR